jgi:hypothetical protein
MDKIDVLRTGTQVSVLNVIKSFEANKLTSREMLDIVIASPPHKQEALGDALTYHVVVDVGCGGEWAMCLSGLLLFGGLADVQYQSAILFFLQKANMANANATPLMLQRMNNHLQAEEQRKTDTNKADGEVRVEQARRGTEQLLQDRADRRLGIGLGVGVGGAAGAAAGAAAGIAIGMAVPGIGNLVGGLVGLALGAAGIGGLGGGIAHAVHPVPEQK